VNAGPRRAAHPTRSGPAHDRHVEALEGGLLGREMAASVHRAPQPALIDSIAFVVQITVLISRSN